MAKTGVCSQTQTTSMKPALCIFFFWKTSFDLSRSICIYHFIGVLRHNTESLHSLAEQWARDEHVGCERTNPVDLFLWISFSLSFRASWFDQRIIQPSLVLLLRTTLLYLFPYLSSAPVPSSFSAVTSSGQQLSIALSRTQPGVVYMATERRDGWRQRRRERRARENDRHNQVCVHAHTLTSHRLYLFLGKTVMDACACHSNHKKKKKWLLITHSACLCAHGQVELISSRRV